MGDDTGGRWAEPFTPSSGGRPWCEGSSSAAVAGAALLAAFGCGGGGNDASVDSGTREQVVTPAADDAADPTVAVGARAARRSRTRACSSTCPADWPVHDLAADPTTCVRFDVHAVYLGHPGADMDCPSGLVGRADAVLVEPTQGERHRGSQVGADAADVVGRDRQRSRGAGRDGRRRASEVAADVPTAGVSVTLTYNDSDATAQQILQSFRAAS